MPGKPPPWSKCSPDKLGKNFRLDSASSVDLSPEQGKAPFILLEQEHCRAVRSAPQVEPTGL